MKSFLFYALAVLAAARATAAKIDTIAVFSPSMDKELSTLVIVPQGDSKPAPFPVIFLLHGYGGNSATWLEIKPELPAIADREGILFVCPDGKNSWYMDSPLCADCKYETFIAGELIPYINAHYPVLDQRRYRAVTGLSMGGYGAMTLAMKHQELFGAAGSTSGGLDIRPFPRNWELNRLLGEQYLHPENWETHTPVRMISRLKNGDLRILIDCGYADFFLQVNEDFHRQLLRYSIDHDFYLRPGGHNPQYWRNSIDYQILFFSNYFRE